MRSRSLAAMTALALASIPFVASPALSADTTIGETFANSENCGNNFTVLQTGPASYAAPTAGVLTSWSAAAAQPYVAGLRVGRVAADSTYSIVAGTAPITLSTTQTRQQAVRIPVLAGDVIGIHVPTQETNALCGREAGAAFTYAFAQGDASLVVPAEGSFQLNVAATLEADADGDGYGDTTQDRCPSQAATQGACADVTAPTTTITKVKATRIKADLRGKRAKARVTVRFRADEASTFTCSVDGRASRSCSSPLTVRLKKGRHTIAVRATDAAGNTDVTPAVRTFTVRRAKR